MCDSIFAHEADVTVNDDSVDLTFYVAYPIPSFSDQGADGTIKDVVLTVDEQEYTAESDITTKPVKTFDTAGLSLELMREMSLPHSFKCKSSKDGTGSVGGRRSCS